MRAFLVISDIKWLSSELILSVKHEWSLDYEHVGDFEITIACSLVKRCATESHLLIFEFESVIEEKQPDDFMKA